MTDLDHFGIRVGDFDATAALLCDHLGLRLGRIGTHVVTGLRIGMLWDDGAGMKVELMEADPADATPAQLAFRVDDVAATLAKLAGAGCEVLSEPFEIPAARAVSASARHGALEIQLVRYAPDAPDLPR